MSLKKNTYSLLKKDQKSYLIFIFILIIFTTLLETLSIASFYPLLDLIITSNNSQEHQIQKIYSDFLIMSNINENNIFNFTIILVGLIFVIKVSALLFCSWHISNFEFSLRYYLTKKLYKKYISQDYLKIIKTNSAEIIKNIDYELSVYSSGVAALMEILTEGIILFGIVIFLFYFNFEVSFAILVSLLIISLILQKLYNKKLLVWGKIHQKYEELKILLKHLMQSKKSKYLVKKIFFSILCLNLIKTFSVLPEKRDFSEVFLGLFLN